MSGNRSKPKKKRSQSKRRTLSIPLQQQQQQQLQLSQLNYNFPDGFHLRRDTCCERLQRRFNSFVASFLFRRVLGAPNDSFSQVTPPQQPNYDNITSWSALPSGLLPRNVAHLVPTEEIDTETTDDEKPIDCFFVHSTSAIGGHNKYNQEYDDPATVELVDHSYNGFAASVNHLCRIYAPRYRQGTFGAFLQSKTRHDCIAAVDLAYSDIKRAFSTFLAMREENGDGQRPFILLGHSQGGVHLSRLVQDVLDKDASLSDLCLVVYAIGAGQSGFASNFVSKNGRFHSSTNPFDSPGACVGFNLRKEDYSLDQVQLYSNKMQLQPGRWTVDDGWNSSTTHERLWEAQLQTNPLTWREEEYGKAIVAKDQGLSYRDLQYNKENGLDMFALLRGKKQNLHAIGVERAQAPSYRIETISRPNHILITNLEECKDKNLRDLVTNGSMSFEGSFHELEPTLLHFLIRDNVKQRYQGWKWKKNNKSRKRTKLEQHYMNMYHLESDDGNNE